MLVDLTRSDDIFTPGTRREAREALIDSKMVRIDPEVFYEMEDPYHEPTLRIDRRRAKEDARTCRSRPDFRSKSCGPVAIHRFSAIFRSRNRERGASTVGLLRVTALDKRFTYGRQRNACDRRLLHSDIEEGEFVSIVGSVRVRQKHFPPQS